LAAAVSIAAQKSPVVQSPLVAAGVVAGMRQRYVGNLRVGAWISGSGRRSPARGRRRGT
jgi:hypothetical protein